LGENGRDQILPFDRHQMHPLAKLARPLHLLAGNPYPFVQGMNRPFQALDQGIGNPHPRHIFINIMGVFGGFEQKNTR